MASTEKKESIGAARALMAQTRSGALGSINQDGSPLVTLVAIAIMEDGAPLLLLSRIAAHTQNILREPHASLLIEGTSDGPDPMTAPRLSLGGKVLALDDAEIANAKARFLEKHPGSEPYDTELDFNYYRLAIESARFNQGFGRFRKLSKTDILRSLGSPEEKTN
ncbi:pyridoxamine 5'-phosphate oxidase family protein [Parvibaculaceae bacterium PLY_AMNH_Bact1]|nr:pyridoxamine 5'-phosphate oxidase family protein [Parvibaculaceae bacterium PLY_AMNH_Bact1]